VLAEFSVAFPSSMRIEAKSAWENSCMDSLKKMIREVPDYPKLGILFYDITTLLKTNRLSLDGG